MEIRKDILLKLTEYCELNQTSLLSYCGLNLVKHKDIVDLEQKGFVDKLEEPWGNKKIIKYKITEGILQKNFGAIRGNVSTKVKPRRNSIGFQMQY